jgi:hypothetical protein
VAHEHRENPWAAAASSINSSETVIEVAIFLTGSSTVSRSRVDSGLVPPSATPVAALVAALDRIANGVGGREDRREQIGSPE